MFKKLMQRFDRMLGRGVIDDELYEELEETLLQADTNIHDVGAILEELRGAVRSEKITDPAQMKQRLKQAIASRFTQEGTIRLNRAATDPTVYLFIGVNGVGKTTTIAKLAQRLTHQGQKVVLAAGDTFRAAAIEQLETWAQRVGAEIVRAQPGGDPAAVIFDAIQAAKARGAQFVLADTAGRQHSKENLMAELQKVTRVVERGLGRPADEVLLVLDANTGQNAIRQAEEFTKACGVTGLVLTKLDGTARGGALIGIYERFKIPVKLTGWGETAKDLRDFDAAEFAAGLFDDESN
ncbi:MAG TPA: signal recognition particle-docking protein FtsY [Fimbriimonadaceae bacterium]|nr:signal recognition particle-docking protein FtsY [Fimbriimonadaceae bacterium]HRJ32704.1 signal recognition particle-docking protein FtsY [Fimbriimonadaceae bacterium]